MKRNPYRILRIAALLTACLYIPGLTGCSQIFQANIESLLRPQVIQTGFLFPFTFIGRLLGLGA